MEDVKAFDIDIISGTCDDVINYQLALTSVSCTVQPKRHTTSYLAGFDNFRAAMNGHVILNPLAKPPCAFGRQVALNEAGSPSSRQAVHHARKVGHCPRFRSGSEPRNW